MANARKKRERKFPQAEFEIPIADALAALLRTRDIEAGATWFFQVEGDVLKITRVSSAEEVPVVEDAAAPAGKPA